MLPLSALPPWAICLQVSRRIFQPLFPRWPQVEVPVGMTPRAYQRQRGGE
jgi:hypothetical protein